MNDELNDFLAEKTEEEPQVDEGQAQEASAEAETPETQGEPTSPGTDKHVPLAALEAERGQRRDWKEKALRYEGELKAIREQRERPQQAPEEQRQMDPFQMVQQQMLNQRFETSELIAKQTHKDLDEKVQVFMEAAKQNPALVAAMQREVHPYEFAYREAERIQLQKEMGGDPSAYRAKIEAEIREQLKAEMGQSPTITAPAAPRIPTSLAGARSAAGRTASSFSGPPSLDDILKQ